SSSIRASATSWAPATSPSGTSSSSGGDPQPRAPRLIRSQPGERGAHRVLAVPLDDAAVRDDDAIEIVLAQAVDTHARRGVVSVNEAGQAVPAGLAVDAGDLEVEARREVVGRLEVLGEVGADHRPGPGVDEERLAEGGALDEQRDEVVLPVGV